MKKRVLIATMILLIIGVLLMETVLYKLFG